MTSGRIYSLALISMIVLVVFLLACSDKATVPNNGDQALPELRALTPEAVLGEKGFEVSLSWEYGNDDGDEFTYDICLGTTQPPPLVESGLRKKSYTFSATENDSIYYWSVTVWGSHGRCNQSPIWQYVIRAPFQYPLMIGRNWEYTGQLFFFNFQPDSQAGQFGDTLIRTTLVEVAALDTVPGGTEVYRLHETMTQDDLVFESDTYFENQKRGLFYHGCVGMSFAAPLKLACGYTFEFKGKRFHSRDELLAYFSANLQPVNAICGDNPTFHDPPHKSLQFPMEVGSQWNFRPSGDPWIIDKQIVSEGLVEVPAGSFEAYKVVWLYDLDEDGEYEEDISVWDYISHDGLISRTILITGIQIIDYDLDTLGTADALEKWELTNLIKPTQCPAEIESVVF